MGWGKKDEYHEYVMHDKLMLAIAKYTIFR